MQTNATPNTLNLQAFGIFNGYAPESGPMAMPVQLSLVGNTPVILNLQSQLDNDIIPFIQAIYYDNSSNDSAVSISFSTTNQTILLQPFSYGYLPVLFSKSPIVTITNINSGTQTTTFLIHFLSNPVPAVINSLTQNILTPNNNLLPLKNSSLIATLLVSASGNTALYTNPGNKTLIITDIHTDYSTSSSVSGGANTTILIQSDSTATLIYKRYEFFPTTAPSSVSGSPNLYSTLNNIIVPGGEGLQVNLSNTLASGKWLINIYGYLINGIIS